MVTEAFNWTVLFNKPYKVYTQLVFWLVVYCMYIVLKEYPQSLTGAARCCIVLQETLELAIPCYAQIYIVLPLLRQGKWLTGLLLYIAQVILLIYLLPYLLNAAGAVFVTFFPFENRVDWTLEHITFSIIAFTVVASFFKTGLDKLMLDKEQKETALKQLKAQLNPHFLFNTLNNLYGLSVVKSDKLPQLMLQLSDLLRYSLYDTNQTYVALQKELTYINNYVELEQLRLDEKTSISWETKGDFSNQVIAPLVLIVFIENSFKHYSAPRNQQAFVHIQVHLQQQELQVNIRNSLDSSLFKAQQHTIRKGIGLANVRQRLQMLYPEKHVLSITHTPDQYQVNLTINLS